MNANLASVGTQVTLPGGGSATIVSPAAGASLRFFTKDAAGSRNDAQIVHVLLPSGEVRQYDVATLTAA